MPRHIRIECSRCHRPDLRIRPEYLGQTVRCKHCGKAFVARAADVPTTMTPPIPSSPRAGTSTVVGVEPEPRPMVLDMEVQPPQSGLSTRTAESFSTLQQLREAEVQLARFRDHAHGL